MKSFHDALRRSAGCLCLLAAAGVLTLAGCSSTPTRVDTGAVRAKTFNFFDARAANSAPLKPREAEIHGLIQAAIVKELAAKGLTKVEKDGDVTVTYLVIVSDGGKTVSYNEFYGVGGPADDLQLRAHDAFTVKNRNLTQYKAGTLLVDVANFREYQVYWRNYVWSPILSDLPDAERKDRLEGFVRDVLKPLRITRQP